MLPNCHFMFLEDSAPMFKLFENIGQIVKLVGRYWSCNSKVQFHDFCKKVISYYQVAISCFLEDIDPMFKLFENIGRIVGLFGRRPFQCPKNAKLGDVPKLRFRKCFAFVVLICGVSWCLQRYIILFWGVMDTSTKSEKHKNNDFSGFPKMNPKNY